MSNPPGAAWCAQYPCSTSLGDLIPPFRDNATDFVTALRKSGASVEISTTWRPAARAYLMYWACCVAGYREPLTGALLQSAPDMVPEFGGVDIDWTAGGDVAAARAGAEAMVKTYDIVYPAALVSRHTQRRAMDITVRWQGTIAIAGKDGKLMHAAAQADLIPIGKIYGVIKLISDPPHWSDDGH